MSGRPPQVSGLSHTASPRLAVDVLLGLAWHLGAADDDVPATILTGLADAITTGRGLSSAELIALVDRAQR